METINLPDDIVIKILSRLTAKTLMRFRCVCKSWNDLITHPTFITMHLNHACSYNNNKGFLQYVEFGFHSRIVRYLLCEQTYVHKVKMEITTKKFPLLVGSLNGLACLSFQYGRTICLWNPSIHKSKDLPHSSTFTDSELFHFKSSVAVGLGFDSQTNDYKIVRILYGIDVDLGYIANSPPPPVEIYSLSTDSWRRIEALVPCYVSHHESQAFFNGCVHWVASKSVAHPDHHNTIMSFDIGGEVFGEMMLPNYNIDGVALEGLSLNLAVLKETLSLCACFKESGHCDIWVMSKYGVVESWTKQFTIVLPEARIQRFLGFTNNVVFLQTSGKLVSYDIRNLQSKIPPIDAALFPSNVFPFVETLVLL